MEDIKEEMTSELAGLTGGGDGSSSNGNGNGKGNGRGSRNKKIKPATLRAYKYTTQEYGLAEEIFLESEGKPKFLLLDPETEELILKDSINLIEEMFAILKPQEVNRNNPNQSLINPYIYKDEQEIRDFIKLAHQVDISDLFLLVEYVWRNVIVAKEKELITLLTNYTLFSYFQDLFEALHYILLTGPPGWGKGAILVTFKLLGYRTVLAGDMSGANLLDLLGTLERCQLSLAEDELDKLDKDENKQRIYKMGYEDTAMVPRTVDAGSSNRRLRIYNPFGCKIFAGENPPDSKYLGGFNDRTFRAEVKKGKPFLLIKKIKKQMERPADKQSPKYRPIIERINFLRKLLLIYRLVHHDDDVITSEEVPLNIYGRPLELCGSSIQLYHNLNNNADNDPAKYKVRDKVMKALGHFLRRKGELDKKTVEATLYRILEDIFNEMEADNEEIKKHTRLEVRMDVADPTVTKQFFVVSYDEICNRFMREVEGVSVSARTFECADFDKVTHDRLISRCRDVFGGINQDIGRDKDKKRGLSFDKGLVKEAGQNFEVVSEIKILEYEEIFEDTAEDNELWSKMVRLNNKVGTNPLIDHPKYEGFGPTIGDKHAQKRQMGTRGFISDRRGNNEQKQNSAEQVWIHNSQNRHIDNENLAKNEERGDDIHNDRSDGTNATGGTFKPKLDPKTPQDEDDKPPWVKENRGWTHEEAEAFKDDAVRIGRRSKVADMATANLSGKGLLPDKEER